jgi:alpha-D-xyloside xylohydrolase
VIPTGPEIQYASEKKGDQLTLWIYTGADGSFTLYEDEGDNNNYEDGAYSLIPFTWNEAERTLTIGAGKGSYQGMPAERTISIVMVSKERLGHGFRNNSGLNVNLRRGD